MDKVHENIRRQRLRLGLSQDEMADRMGIERTTYSNFELGKTKLFSRNMSLFCKASGLSEEEVLFDDLLESRLNDSGMDERLQEMTLEIRELRKTVESLSRQIGKLIRQSSGK